eukprot:GDKI01020991.1.p1 GENE.GDKI01020991.1~~GDKI01020991.1.p1  ORF type:complete len:109 (+),score=24.97 GDKI01020991.1:15-341(+)
MHVTSHCDTRVGVATEWHGQPVDLEDDDELFDPTREQLEQWPRLSEDTVLAGQGKELLQLCRTTGMAVLNGRFGISSGAYTCIRASGDSVVDFVLASCELLGAVGVCG